MYGHCCFLYNGTFRCDWQNIYGPVSNQIYQALQDREDGGRGQFEANFDSLGSRVSLLEGSRAKNGQKVINNFQSG